jgi:glucose/arabinose dehydrogenase
MAGKNVRTRAAACLTIAAAAALCACEADDDINGVELEDVDLQLIADRLVSPVALAAPDGSGRLYVVDQIGLIRVIDENGVLQQEPFLDLTRKIVQLQPAYDERGLLGLAFHPDWPVNRHFYVFYSAPLRFGAISPFDHTNVISEFEASPNPVRANAASERIILQVDQPQFNNNGGTLAFGRDGFLYISLGDGGGVSDMGVGHGPGGNAQNTQEPLGSILRIDIDGPRPYSVPASNPFVGTRDGIPEIWAFGFHNPYRMSFDKLTGDLFVGDPGERLWEEVDQVIRGGNYGWNIKEGTHCFNPGNPDVSLPTCPSTDQFGDVMIDPVIEYANVRNPLTGLGTAVIGGFMYRGFELDGYFGRYIFGDFSTSLVAPRGRVWVATPRRGALWQFIPLPFGDGTPGQLVHYLKGFGEDQDGELYLLTSDQAGPTGGSGRVFRIVPSNP